MLESEIVRYLRVTDIAAIYGISRGYVYVLANRHSWRRIKVGREVRYHITDIAESIGN
jgi:predicted DNA-binding transcriptional regulator AlpA